jgi:hypothetical protein
MLSFSMARLGKYLCLCIVVMFTVASPLVVLPTTDAQTIPKPSVPQFTINLADHSYNVPLTTTSTINPYTGQQENHTQGGYHIENKTIDVSILNQPFTSVTIDGNTTQLYYVIRWKGHYENWNDNITYSGFDYNYYLNLGGLKASNSEYTVKSYSLPIQNGKIDFQVKAQAGYTFLYYGNHAHIQPIGTDFQADAESYWSPIQTVTIGESSRTNTPSPSAPEFPITATLIAVIVAVSLCLVISKRKAKYQPLRTSCMGVNDI